MPRRLALLTGLLLVTPALAQKPEPAPAPPGAGGAAPEAVACTYLEGRNRPGTIEATAYRVVVRDGRAAAVLLELPGNRSSRTELSPGPRPGQSVRLTAFQRAGSGAWETVFNAAVLAPDGTLTMETYLGATDRPGAPPAVNWYRLRCPAPDPSPAPAPAPAPTPAPAGKG